MKNFKIRMLISVMFGLSWWFLLKAAFCEIEAKRRHEQVQQNQKHFDEMMKVVNSTI